MKELWKRSWMLFVLILSTTLPPTVMAQGTSTWGISLNGYNSSSIGPSSLYMIDPDTGAGTQVGSNLGYTVNAIAIDPTTGLMYASMAR